MTMPREDLLAKYKHLLRGLVADAAVQRRHGGELSVFLSTSFDRIDGILNQIHADMTPKAEPKADAPKPQNGQQGPHLNTKGRQT